jgi:fucose permease
LFGAGVAAIVMLLTLRGLVPDRGASESHDPAFALPPRALVPMGIVAFCALVCEGAIGDWGAIYLREGLASTPGVAAAGYAVFALLMAAGRFTGDWLTMRFGAARVVRVSGILVVGGIALALVSRTPWIAIAGFAFIGAGVSCIFPLILSAAARTPGVTPGTGIAAMATAGYTGFLAGPPLRLRRRGGVPARRSGSAWRLRPVHRAARRRRRGQLAAACRGSRRLIVVERYVQEE